jgi:hypothetical protein
MAEIVVEAEIGAFSVDNDILAAICGWIKSKIMGRNILGFLSTLPSFGLRPLAA